jgi:hypothetical protein
MTMAASVQRPVGGARTCTKSDGSMKSTYASLQVARRVARRYPGEGIHAFTCGTCGLVHLGHRPPEVRLACARCGGTDGTVYAAPTADGGRFPPLCTDCQVKIMRIRSVAKAVETLEGGCD